MPFDDVTIILLLIILVVGLFLGSIIGLLVGGRGKKQNSKKKSSESKDTAKTSERQNLRALYQITATLTSTLDYQKVLGSALDLVTDALASSDPSANKMLSAVLLFDGDHLAVRSTRRLTRTDANLTFPGLQGLLQKTINDREPTWGKDPANDPELGQIIAIQNCRAAYCVPLRSGLDIYGVLLFAHPDLEYFTPERRDMLDIVAAQAIIAMQNARLFHELELEKERMAETQEEARKKLARDLHDGPTQSIAAIAMRLNFTRRLMERDPKEAAEELFKIEDLARRTTKEIRHMLFTLRPLVLETQGFKAALKAMGEKMKETYSQNVLIDVDETILSMLDEGKKGVMFFIVEEAANNARKHANAAHIWVRLKSAQHDLAILEIQDDGSGFDVDSTFKSYDSRSSSSLGMINLRERAELINGVLQIDSRPREGTRIRIWIPLTEDALARIRAKT